jgi:hypothetical protein
MKRKIQAMPRKTLTHQQVVDLVMTLPPDRLISVYEFTLFVMSHPLMPAEVADIFGENAEEMRADEAEWDQQFEASREDLRAIAHEAAEEFRAGRTKPMEFSPEGRLVR